MEHVPKGAWRVLGALVSVGILVGGLGLGLRALTDRPVPADGTTTTTTGTITTTVDDPDNDFGVESWFGDRRVVEGGCRQFPEVAVVAEPVLLTLDTADWDEAVKLRVDAVEACRLAGSGLDSVADEVLRVTVLRHVAGTEDRGLGVRRVAQFAPGSLGSD